MACQLTSAGNQSRIHGIPTKYMACQLIAIYRLHGELMQCRTVVLTHQMSGTGSVREMQCDLSLTNPVLL